MNGKQLIYRNGRLQLPADIADWSASELAGWLQLLPLDDRVRAFRALPFNRAAMGYMALPAVDRATLLGALNGDNRRRLAVLSGVDSLVETLRNADTSTRTAVLAELPETRRGEVEARLEALAAQEAALAGQQGKGRRKTWGGAVGRMLRRRGRRHTPAA
ncbi:hypothetical protein QWY84_09990 [Aquisalimonas lutea]|uniref:hypothetical protein n=1 Tax=Aquisalimonas lutea TaxID=1327750 RepID=UPI0025B31EBA|nr:hypothetical protein [Aquisalimonas lutea]MDN3517941.1 hypothetical protein [Aquisalimonas lutea]